MFYVHGFILESKVPWTQCYRTLKLKVPIGANSTLVILNLCWSFSLASVTLFASPKEQQRGSMNDLVRVLRYIKGGVVTSVMGDGAIQKSFSDAFGFPDMLCQMRSSWRNADYNRDTRWNLLSLAKYKATHVLFDNWRSARCRADAYFFSTTLPKYSR